MADDAFISLRYSERFINDKGLTWSDGQRVEGYTNLLWVLFCAVLGKLGVDLVLAARLLGVVSTVVAFCALTTYIKDRIELAGRPRAAACSLLPVALSAPIAVWMIGGLEQPLLLGFLGWAFVYLTRYLQEPSFKRALFAGVCLCGVTLTRADGFVFVLILSTALFAVQTQRSRSQSTIVLWLPLIAASCEPHPWISKIYVREEIGSSALLP